MVEPDSDKYSIKILLSISKTDIDARNQMLALISYNWENSS